VLIIDGEAKGNRISACLLAYIPKNPMKTIFKRSMDRRLLKENE
jgi:hypothetical protein